MDRLRDDYSQGRPIDGFPSLRSMAFQRSPRVDGHIAVYEIDHDAETVTVLQVFPTKQDLPGRLRDER